LPDVVHVAVAPEPPPPDIIIDGTFV